LLPFAARCVVSIVSSRSMGITAESKNPKRGRRNSCKCLDVSEDGTLLLPR
jgi:hypothetical protein